MRWRSWRRAPGGLSPAWTRLVAASAPSAEAGGIQEEIQWRPATNIELVIQSGYAVTSVAFVGSWVLAKNENGVVAFPSSQVMKVTLG